MLIKVKVAFLLDSLPGNIYMVLPLGYHLLKKNENALHNLGYTGPIKQTSKKFNIKLQKKSIKKSTSNMSMKRKEIHL